MHGTAPSVEFDESRQSPDISFILFAVLHVAPPSEDNENIILELSRVFLVPYVSNSVHVTYTLFFHLLSVLSLHAHDLSCFLGGFSPVNAPGSSHVWPPLPDHWQTILSIHSPAEGRER